MPELGTRHVSEIEVGIARWRDLYRLGAIACLVISLAVMFAVVVFLIWPYMPGTATTADILVTLQEDRLGGLFALDLLLLLIELVSILPLLALYAALKRVNESYALIALVVGLMAVVLTVQARPLAELVLLSERYTQATTAAARIQSLTAAEALLVYFDGTAWMIFTVFIALSGLISSLLMLRSEAFGPWTAYLGIVTTVPGFGFFIPVVGPLLLFVGTFGGVVWYVLVARALLHLARGGEPA
jgi:hypothetical protein